MAERVIGPNRPRNLMEVVLSLTNRVDGQDIMDLVSKTGRTDRGVKRVVKKLKNEGRLHESAGRYSSHPALKV